jgi:hypothetical protein
MAVCFMQVQRILKTSNHMLGNLGVRRKALHEDIFQSPLSILSFITKYLDDLKLTRLIEDNETTKSTSNQLPNGYLRLKLS